VSSPALEQEQSSSTPFGLLVPERMGKAVLGIAEQAGGIGVLAGRLLARLRPSNVDRYELVRNAYKMGVRSVGIVSFTALFVGAIMVIQIAPLVVRFGATAIIGWGAGFAMLREVGPLLIALMFSGRVGANNTAELGTMVVTEQLDALRALSIDPITYLILPRVISMVVMLFVLTIFGDLVALGGAIISAKALLDVDPAVFLHSFFEMLDHWDFLQSLIKAIAFGVMISITSCHFGLSTKGGAPGVGRSVNAAVVAAAIGIFVMDYFFTFIMK
jgi:phospholipid/cholesterol/gamma-HCH transport system permease protein